MLHCYSFSVHFELAGTRICESNLCECDRAPLSGYNYFGQGTTSSDGIDEGCECDPDDCYNINYPMVSMCVCGINFHDIMISSLSRTCIACHSDNPLPPWTFHLIQNCLPRVLLSCVI